MAEITAGNVAKLREMTGVGMMECKKALIEANGDINAAVDLLRKSGAASAAKKDGTSRYVTPFRAPTVLQVAGKGKDLIRLENYDDQDFGYLRIVVTQKQLRIEYHPAPDGDAAKTPDDVVAVDLSTRTLVAPQV